MVLMTKTIFYENNSSPTPSLTARRDVRVVANVAVVVPLQPLLLGVLRVKLYSWFSRNIAFFTMNLMFFWNFFLPIFSQNCQPIPLSAII